MEKLGLGFAGNGGKGRQVLLRFLDCPGGAQ